MPCLKSFHADRKADVLHGIFSYLDVEASSSAGGFNEASSPTVDLMLLVTPEQFEDQAMHRDPS